MQDPGAGPEGQAGVDGRIMAYEMQSFKGRSLDIAPSVCALMLCVVTLPEHGTHIREPKEGGVGKLHHELWLLLTINFVPQVGGGLEALSHMLWLKHRVSW